MIEVTVNDDLTVTVTINGIEVDHPGPWGDQQGAEQWADAIRASLEAGNHHYVEQA